MTDLPPGRWSNLVVGHQWPRQTSLAVIADAEANRHAIGVAYEGYANEIAAIRSRTLANQRGLAADSAQAAFLLGEESSHNASERNLAKASAYSSAHSAVAELRSNLREIAQRVNDDIHQISLSGEPYQTKLNKVVAIVVAGQSEANLKAAIHSDNILDAIQRVLRTTEVESSSREFAHNNGVDLGGVYRSCGSDIIRDQASSLLSEALRNSAASNEAPESLATVTTAGNTTHLETHSPVHDASPNSLAGNTTRGNTAPVTSIHLPKVEDIPLKVAAGAGDTTTAPPMRPQPIAQMTPTHGGVPLGTASPIGREPATPFASDIRSATPTASLPTDRPTPLSPTDVAHGFNAVTPASAPVSAGTEAVSANAVHAAHQTPTHTPAMPAPPTAPFTPVATSPEAAVAHAAVDAPAPPPVIAAPQQPMQAGALAQPATPVSMPAQPAGSLPAYGADLRAPAATTPAASPTPAAPMSAHLSGSATSALGQPSVVRHQSVPPPATTATALTERAVAATATGSAAGAAAAHATAQLRLQRLLASVARQAPKLGWAIGDRTDQTTVLTTDLASGWIPPDIQIPSGVILLTPENRSGSLAGLLGETTLTATHIPGQPLPQDNAEPPPTSTRPRQTAPVDDLHWELAQATKWRDGLPRLAHTLARAISSDTGYLDSEVQLLREALAGVAKEAISSYPNTDTNFIGNWQLLATIEALINNENVSANYHLAWFRATSTTQGAK